MGGPRRDRVHAARNRVDGAADNINDPRGSSDLRHVLHRLERAKRRCELTDLVARDLLGQVADVAGFLAFHVKYSTVYWRSYRTGPGCAKKTREALSGLWDLELERTPGGSFYFPECAHRAEALP